MADAGTILQGGFFMGLVLPFLLVFTVVFAVLQKSKILGDGKRQIDALVAVAIGLIVIAYGQYVRVITDITAFLGVAIVVILIFMILTGMFYEPGRFELHNGVKYAGMGLAAVAVVIATLYYTHAWDYLINTLKGDGTGNAWLFNIIFIVIIGAAVAALVFGGEKSSEKKKD